MARGRVCSSALAGGGHKCAIGRKRSPRVAQFRHSHKPPRTTKETDRGLFTERRRRTTLSTRSQGGCVRTITNGEKGKICVGTVDGTGEKRAENRTFRQWLTWYARFRPWHQHKSSILILL